MRQKFTMLMTLCLSFGRLVYAQLPMEESKAPSTVRGKAAATLDLTGYWVSVVTEDWRWRMVTPLKGDAASVRTNAVARKLIEAWDPAKDEAAGLQCKAYGAPAIMRVPRRSEAAKNASTDCGWTVQ